MSDKSLVPVIPAEKQLEHKNPTLFDHLIAKLVRLGSEGDHETFKSRWHEFKKLMFIGAYFCQISSSDLAFLRKALLRQELYQESWQVAELIRGDRHGREHHARLAEILFESRLYPQAAWHFRRARNIAYMELFEVGGIFLENHTPLRKIIMNLLVSEAECWLWVQPLRAKDPLRQFDENVEILAIPRVQFIELFHRYKRARVSLIAKLKNSSR